MSKLWIGHSDWIVWKETAFCHFILKFLTLPTANVFQNVEVSTLSNLSRILARPRIITAHKSYSNTRTFEFMEPQVSGASSHHRVEQVGCCLFVHWHQQVQETFTYESVTFKVTHFVFHVTQKHFIICMFHKKVSRLLHIMKNKICHFECHGLILIWCVNRRSWKICLRRLNCPPEVTCDGLVVRD